LHLFNDLAHRPSSSLTSFTSKTLFGNRSARLLPGLRISVSQGYLELGNRLSSAFKVALCLRVYRNSNCMAALIGGYFRIETLLTPEARLCPTQDLKSQPTDADVFQFTY